MRDKIIQKEEELRLAMLANDVTKLDLLIDESLVFICPDGSLATKEMDLAAHRSKLQNMSEITPSEQIIVLYDNLATVTVRMSVKGSFNAIEISGDYRYLRVWKKFGEDYRIVSGSVSKILP